MSRINKVREIIAPDKRKAYKRKRKLIREKLIIKQEKAYKRKAYNHQPLQ